MTLLDRIANVIGRTFAGGAIGAGVGWVSGSAVAALVWSVGAAPASRSM